MDNGKRTGSIWTAYMTKGKAIYLGCAVAVLLGLSQSGCSKSSGKWQYSGKVFIDVFDGFPKNEGEVYYNNNPYVKVMQATKKGNLVGQSYDGSAFDEPLVWVETTRRYVNGETLDKGYYIRRGSREYTSLVGERTVARYVEVTGSLLEKVKKQIEEEKAAAEAKMKKELAEIAAAGAKEHAEREAVVAKPKAEIAAMQVGRTAGETTTITLPGGVSMEMVWCPPGTFTMGSSQGVYSEKPPHEVTLTKGFWMGKTEVTQAQWKSVMGNNWAEHEGDDLPMETVSWAECQEFCEVLGLQLPTEAQWEYACRAGSTGEYAGTGDLDEMGWYRNNSGGETHPVGKKQPNAWGLYDMHGNVWEWCADWYGDYPNGAETDPQGPSSGTDRVLRGGRWGNDPGSCTSSSRTRGAPPFSNGDLGFRVVRTLSE